MQSVSNDFLEELNNDNRRYLNYCSIILSDDTILEVDNTSLWDGGLKIEDSVSSNTSFDIGAAVINKCTLTLNNIYDDFSGYELDGAEAVVYVGLELPDGTIERIRKGTYAVDETTYNGSIITLSCLDNMRKFDRPYSESTLVYPATLLQIVQDACDTCGVQLMTTSFDNSGFVVPVRPDDDALTFREVLSWAAQLACRWARCDAYGRLVLGWYDLDTLADHLRVTRVLSDAAGRMITTADGAAIAASEQASGSVEGAYHSIKSFSSLTVSTDDVVITGIKVVKPAESTEDSEEEYLEGTEGYILSIEDNKLVQTGNAGAAAAFLGSQIIGMRFRPFSASHLSDPSIEAGDVVELVGRKETYYSIITSTTFAINNYQSTSCDAESPARNSSSRYSNATKTYVALRKLIQAEKTARETAVENLATLLANGSGMYITTELQPDGSSIYYMHNKPTLAESNIVWKLTAEAFGVSTDGGKTYPYGFTITGEMITRLLYAEGIDADYINTGAITVKDSDGNIIFSVDMNTGQVIISGDSVRIGGKTATQAISDTLTEAKDYSDGKLADYANVVTGNLTNLQAQIDGQIETWFYDYIPTDSNLPASDWTTDAEKSKHLGDLFYVIDNTEYGGQAYRYALINGVYQWDYVEDTAVVKALAAAQTAQDTADGKRRVFVATPTPPYDIGDLWTNGTDILTCTVARASGSSYVSSDWKKLNKYTDDSFAEQVQENLDNLQLGGTQMLRGTNTVTVLTSTGIWANGTWRQASTTPDSDTIMRTSISVTDSPNANIKVGWRISQSGTPKLVDIAQNLVPVSYGQTYTMSCYARWVSGEPKLRLQTWRATGVVHASTIAVTDGSWKRYSYTFVHDFANYPDATNIYFGNCGDGTLEICGMMLETGNKAGDWKPAPEDTETYADNLAADLQTQIDGKIETYNQTSDPSTAWTTTALKIQHTGDLWYNPTTKETKRWSGTAWVKLENKEAEEASELAQKKAQVFTGTPTIPYYVGDLWFNSATSDIMTCVTARTTGSYTASDWAKRNKYTDDTTASEALDEARKARNLNVILDNEYQGIPTDYEGNYTDFSTCQTGVQVYYGSTDVTAICTFAVTASTGVTGSWDSVNKVYTVTALSTDAGWVDIAATYLSTLTTTKRFNIAKVKGGIPGETGAQGTQGINLLRFTKEMTGHVDYISSTSVVTYETDSEGFEVATIPAAGAYYSVGFYMPDIAISEIEGKQVTISAWVQSDGLATYPAGFQISTGVFTSNNTRRRYKGLGSFSNVLYNTQDYKDGEWVKIIRKATLPLVSDMTASSETEDYVKYGVQFYVNSNNSLYPLQVKKVKLEYGTTEDPVWTPAIEDLQGADGRGVSSTAVAYQASTSGTTAPTGTWSTSVPSVAAGSYLWTRTVITYTDNTTSTLYSIGKMGNTGTAGVGISSITNYYLASASGTGVTTSTTGWTTTVQTITTTNKYLWNYEVVTYTDGTKTTTTPCIIGAYGNTGTPGTAGRGISSITEYYLVSSASSGVTTSTSGWGTAIVTTTSANKYLWNYEKITYTDGTTSTTTPKIIGTHGATGATGTAGRVYILEPSTLVIKKSADGAFAPAVINFAAYYRDGNSATRTAYAGRFAIEESADGATWTTVYTSAANESSTEYSPYTVLGTAASAAITNAAGNMIVAYARDVAFVRCTLYAAGGTTNALDSQTVTTVVDVSALTHEDIFNLLTNNGEIKGIYQEGNQLYISFTYAKGGTLTLGGANNGNGVLQVLDANEVKWMELVRNGMRFYNVSDGAYLGRIGINAYTDGTKELAFDASESARGLAWSRLMDDGSSELVLQYAADSDVIKTHKPIHLADSLYTNGYNIYFWDKVWTLYYGNALGIGIGDGSHIYLSDGSGSIFYGVTSELISCYVDLDMANNTILNASDERLKTNIKKSEMSALDVINAVQTYEFDWIETGKHENLGFIAQQIEAEADASLVSVNEKSGQYSVKSIEMIPYLVKSIQELAGQVEELKQEIKALKGENQKATFASVHDAGKQKWRPTGYTDEEKRDFVEKARPKPEKEVLPGQPEGGK